MAKFLIGETARFDSDTFTLTANQSDATPLSLGAAAGRCLLVLLEADGEIVTKKTLLTEAWEQYGAVVSTNNLSQAMVQIRRALEQLGSDPALLVTVPRIGYRLNQSRKLSPFVDANAMQSVLPVTPAVPIPHFDREITQNSLGESNVSSVAEAAEPTEGRVTATPVDGVAPATVSNASPATAIRKGIRPAFAFGSMLAAALISGAAAWQVVPSLRGDLRTNAKVAVWQSVANDATHRYFVTPDRAQDVAYIADRIAALRREPPVSVDDLDARRVYINGTRQNDIYSYMLCRRAIETASPDCVSYLISAGPGGKAP